MFSQIVLGNIKTVSMLERVRGFVPKSWTSVRQSKLTVVSLAKKILYEKTN